MNEKQENYRLAFFLLFRFPRITTRYTFNEHARMAQLLRKNATRNHRAGSVIKTEKSLFMNIRLVEEVLNDMIDDVPNIFHRSTESEESKKIVNYKLKNNKAINFRNELSF